MTNENLLLQQEASLLRSTATEADIQTLYATAWAGFIIAAMGAFIISLNFVIHWWVGKSWSEIGAWNASEWVSVLCAIALVAAVTAGQLVAYQHPVHFKSIIVLKIFAVAFSLLTEIGMSLEREDTRIRTQSVESATFKAATNAIGSVAQGVAVTAYSSSPAMQQASASLAKAQVELASCDRHKSADRRSTCERIERGNIAAAQGVMNAESSARVSGAQAIGNTLQGAIQQARGLERDENNASGITKFFAGFFGISVLASSFALSTLLIGAFEYAFFVMGRIVAQCKMALGGKPLHDAFNPSDLHVDMQSTRANTQKIVVVTPENEMQKTALALIWNAIDTGKIDHITTPDSGQVSTLLKDNGFGRTNDRRRELVYWVIDALLKEGVIMKNPDWKDGEKNGNRPEHVINPSRKIKYGAQAEVS
jgi:hypothetical protein